MAKLTPAEIVDKQIKRASETVEDFRKGVRNSKKNPMEAAIKKKEKMKRGILKALDNGDWEEGLRSVSHEEYIRLTAEKGGDRYAEGVEAARDKMMDFQEQVSPVRENISKKVEGMPDDTYEQREARMLANVRGMRAFKFRKRRH